MFHVVPLELIKRDAERRHHRHPKLLVKHSMSIDNEYDDYLSNDYYKFWKSQNAFDMRFYFIVHIAK